MRGNGSLGCLVPPTRMPYDRGLDWNVHQVIAHVLCVARRYQAVAEGRDFRRARHPRELDRINHEEMQAAMAPIPVLLEDLEALEPVMDAFFDDPRMTMSLEFHCGAMVSEIVAQVNWLFDLVLHGEDIRGLSARRGRFTSARCCFCSGRRWRWRRPTSRRGSPLRQTSAWLSRSRMRGLCDARP